MELHEDIKSYSKFLYEVLVRKNSDILIKIKSLKLSAISGHSWNSFSKCIMKDIYDKLEEWEINIPSFHLLTSDETSLEAFQYLLEMIHNENPLNCDKINELYKRFKKHKNIEDISYCCDHISEYIDELNLAIERYNLNPDIRIHTYKSLKDFASAMYLLLNKLAVELASCHNSGLGDLENCINELIVKLLTSSFVISEYPPKLIKKKTPKQTGTRFNATISCLIEQEKIFSSNLHVNVYFLNEDELKAIQGDLKDYSDSKIPCNDIKRSNNNWSIRNMIWNPQNRQSKDSRKGDRITNIKSIIIFRIKIIANPYGVKKPFNVNKDLFSDVVISVVHTNQEVDASLTLFWDDYFRIDRRSYLINKNFACRDSVCVAELVQAISDYFLKQTSRGLTLSNQRFLENKLLSKAVNGLISFYTFTRNNMIDSSYPFGHWIYLILKLIKVEGTIGMWKNDLIDGFTPKEAEDYFTNYQSGNFFLRFSERNPKIGVVVQANNKCDAWSPFSMEECRCRTLPDRLMDYQELSFIRDANGKLHRKTVALSNFIDAKTPDTGYTVRGHLTRLFEGDIYKEMCKEESEKDFFLTDAILPDDDDMYFE